MTIRPSAATRADVRAADAAELGRECVRLASYLAECEPSPYQVAKYIDAHRVHRLAPRTAFDAMLLRTAARGRLGLRLADAYTGLFYRTAVLRSKLVVLLGVLESSPPTYRRLDAPTSERFVLDMILLVLASAGTLAVAVAVLGPAHLWTRLVASRR